MRRKKDSPFWQLGSNGERVKAICAAIVDIMADFLSHMPRLQSLKADRSRAKHLLQFFAKAPMTAENVIAYREARRIGGAGPSTINKEIGLLSCALQHYAQARGLRLDNPCAGLRLKEPPGRVRFLSNNERARLIEAAKENKKAPWLAPFIRLALNTGMRKSELLKLDWPRVDLQNLTIYLTAAHTKNKKPRLIPLNKEAAAALLELRSGARGPWVFQKEGKRIKDVRRSFAQACKKAGLENFRIHDERHDYASRLVQAGVNLYDVKALLGHDTIQSTERYAHLNVDALRKSSARLD